MWFYDGRNIRRERRSGFGVSVSQACAVAACGRSNRVVFVHPPIYNRSVFSTPRQELITLMKVVSIILMLES